MKNGAIVSMLLVLSAGACDREPKGPEPAPTKAATAPEATAKAPPSEPAPTEVATRSEQDRLEPTADPEATPTEPAPKTDRPRFVSTAEEAKAAGLAPLGFSLDLGDVGMSGNRFSGGEYASFSSPPGGTMMLIVMPATVGADPATLVHREGAEVTPQEVELLGAKRRAVAWISGEGRGRTSWCGIVVAPEGAAEGAPALLLELGVDHGGPEITCATTLDDEDLGAMAKSLRLE